MHVTVQFKTNVKASSHMNDITGCSRTTTKSKGRQKSIEVTHMHNMTYCDRTVVMTVTKLGKCNDIYSKSN